MAKKDSSLALRDEIQELREEAAALADRAKKTARLADVLAERLKNLEKQVTDKSNLGPCQGNTIGQKKRFAVAIRPSCQARGMLVAPASSFDSVASIFSRLGGPHLIPRSANL
jgi:oligoribonuclease (3'-5' exoribonuclease)